MTDLLVTRKRYWTNSNAGMPMPKLMKLWLTIQMPIPDKFSSGQKKAELGLAVSSDIWHQPPYVKLKSITLNKCVHSVNPFLLHFYFSTNFLLPEMPDCVVLVSPVPEQPKANAVTKSVSYSKGFPCSGIGLRFRNSECRCPATQVSLILTLWSLPLSQNDQHLLNIAQRREIRPFFLN